MLSREPADYRNEAQIRGENDATRCSRLCICTNSEFRNVPQLRCVRRTRALRSNAADRSEPPPVSPPGACSIHLTVLHAEHSTRRAPFSNVWKIPFRALPVKEGLFVRVHITCNMYLLQCIYAHGATISCRYMQLTKSSNRRCTNSRGQETPSQNPATQASPENCGRQSVSSLQQFPSQLPMSLSSLHPWLILQKQPQCSLIRSVRS